MQVKVSDAWLRNRQQVLLLGFLAEITRHQGLNDFVLDLFGKTLANNGSRDLALAETGDSRQLLVAIHNGLGFSFDQVGWNLDSDFALAGIRRFGRGGVRRV